MIIRVFKAQVRTGLETEFEDKYRTVSVPFMKSCDGMEAVKIGRPGIGVSSDYVMVSQWKSEQHLQAALGDRWHGAHIPAGMEKYIESCSVEHFEEM